MRKPSFLFSSLLLIALAGCNPPPAPETATTSGAPATNETGATTPTSKDTPATTAVKDTPVDTTTQKTPPPASDPRDIKNRIFQLRDLQRVTLKIEGHSIPAWVMDTRAKSEEGLMWVTDKDMKADDGMLFLMPAAEKQSFWMQNTLIPLDIIFIDPGKKVLNIQHGKALDDKTSLPSSGPAFYVLEMKEGAAARLGIKAGSTVSIPKDLAYKGDEPTPGDGG